jgi:hypothetical protein
MRELERLIEAMQKNWLVRKYVNKTNPPPAQPMTGTPQPEVKPRWQSPKSSSGRGSQYP